jgi:hypothetical protein
MIIAGLTIVGLLIAIPMYWWGKKLNFKMRLEPKRDEPFIVLGDKYDWKRMQVFV